MPETLKASGCLSENIHITHNAGIVLKESVPLLQALFSLRARNIMSKGAVEKKVEFLLLNG